MSELQVGDEGPCGGVIVAKIGGTPLYVEVLAYAGASLGKYEVHVYARGPRGGLRYIERTGSTDDLRRSADVRLRAASAADDYVADVVREHTQTTLI